MNTTLTSTLRVYDENDGAQPLVDTTDRAEIARILGDAEIAVRAVGSERAADRRSPIRTRSSPRTRATSSASRTRTATRPSDVIRVTKETPNVPALREKFLNEHTHTEDEVRFFVEGSASFYLRTGGKVYQAICTRGDLIGVPANTTHWFDMGPSPEFAAIRMFVNPDRLGRELHRRRHRRAVPEVRVRLTRARRLWSTSRGRRARSRSCTRCCFRTPTSTSTRTSPRTARSPTSRRRCSTRRSLPAIEPDVDDATVLAHLHALDRRKIARRRRSRRCKG